MNKSTLLTLLMIILGTTVLAPVQAQDELVYVAVEPCRLADTRPTEGGTGALSVGSSRNFSVYGADLSGQGGDASGCLHPREASGVEPAAISAYVVAVPTASSGPGHITAYASDGAIPGNALATVNFEAGQVNGNTTNVPLCIPGATACPLDGQMAVIAFSSEQNVVIDVQRYFYPLSGGDQVGAGQWEGTGQGIYMDGTTSQITDVTANLSQEGTFIYGTAAFTVTVGVNDPVTQGGQLSGHIQGNAIKGLFGGCIGPAPDCEGGAIFEGKLTGDELLGTVVDLTDGSTFTLTLQRTSP